MSPTTRAFIALPLPEHAIREIARLQGDLAPRLPSIRWTKPEQLHLTLAFLGDVPNERLDALRTSVTRAVAPFAPLALTMAGLGAFPTLDRPRVLWVGLEGPDREILRQLREMVAQAARAAGAPPTDDRFSPHITIGRPRPGRRPPSLLSLAEDTSRGSAETHMLGFVDLFASHLSSQGPIYTTLARIPLEPRKCPPSP